MTDDLPERLRAIVSAWIREDLDVGAKLSIGYYGPALIERLKPIEELIQRLEGERDEAIRFMTQYAREAGEAKGRLEMSEAAGIVDGWRERANAAEQALSASQQEVERLKTAVDGVADDYMTSDKHHPGYVLIPTARFERLAALQTGGKNHG